MENYTKEEIESKMGDVYRLLLGLNAYGSLDIKDFRLIVNMIEKSLEIKLNDKGISN